MKPALKFQLNKLMPFLTPPAAKARVNSQYAISKPEYIDCMIDKLEKYAEDQEAIALITDAFMQIVGIGEHRDQNYASILLDTRLVDVTLAILDKPTTKPDNVELILELHILLYANIQCA